MRSTRAGLCHYLCVLIHQQWHPRDYVFCSIFFFSKPFKNNKNPVTQKPHWLIRDVLFNSLQITSPTIKPTAELFNCHYHKSVCNADLTCCNNDTPLVCIPKVSLLLGLIVVFMTMEVWPDKNTREGRKKSALDHELRLYRTFGTPEQNQGVKGFSFRNLLPPTVSCTQVNYTRRSGCTQRADMSTQLNTWHQMNLT